MNIKRLRIGAVSGLPYALARGEIGHSRYRFCDLGL